MVDDGAAFEVGRCAAERPHEADDARGFAGHDAREAERSRGDLVIGRIGVLRRA